MTCSGGVQWWLRRVDQVAFNTSLDVLKARICWVSGVMWCKLFGGSDECFFGRKHGIDIVRWVSHLFPLQSESQSDVAHRQVSWIHALSLLWKMSQVLLQMDVLSVNAVSRRSSEGMIAGSLYPCVSMVERNQHVRFQLGSPLCCYANACFFQWQESMVKTCWGSSIVAGRCGKIYLWER